MIAYAAYNLDSNIRKTSSSGGIFYSLAKYVLEKNGIVFGAAWNKDWLVDMCYVDKLEDLPKLMGSKYVKANNKNTFNECKDFLNAGKLVLYSGTPCQIAALKLFLKADYGNLITVSVACFGTMPVAIWKDYLETIKRPDADIIDINLRDKNSTNWNNYNYTIKYSDEKILSENHLANRYSKAFISANYFNKACYNCNAKKDLKSDICIGDFWGVQEVLPKIDCKLGVSFAICNTKHGNDILNLLQDLYLVKLDSVDKITKYNRGIQETPGTQELTYNKDIFKKKVAIITMNLHYNIGTALQAYALQKVISSFNYDCDVITWARKDRLAFCDKYIKMRILATSKDYDKIKENDYDVLVVGSDQIWRKNTLINDYNNNYINYPFLNFTTGWKKVRFSYAASFGTGNTNWQYNKLENNIIHNILSQFNDISVRELTSISDCKKQLNLTAQQHIDPTMLLSKEEYLDLCTDIPINTQPTLFKYILKETDEKQAFINNKALEHNLKIVTNNKALVSDWLAKIRDASLVITDSFHGVVFSIIFNKPFLYWNNRDAGNMRFDTLEQLFDIKNRQINNITNQYFEAPNIDLKKYRNEALNYIQRNLADVPSKLITEKKNKNKSKKKRLATYIFKRNYYGKRR